MVVIKTGYPSLGDEDFREVLTRRKDYQLFKNLPYSELTKEEFEHISKEQCSGFEKTLYQHLMQHYLSIRSPYRGLLLYHSLGTGKSCSSITIAEALLKDHRVTDEPSIYVVSTGTLHKSYEGQIFSLSHKHSLEELREQCTSDHYLRLVGKTEFPKKEEDRLALQNEVHAMIKKRYKFITYHNFATMLMKLEQKGKLETFRDKVIIIDEAHNLRDEEQQNKALTQPLIKLLRTAKNNRLVLLSATPMYNEPEEILWLLSLLCMNDKRNILDPDQLPAMFHNNKLVASTRKLIEQLASEYISYIRGNSPFTFPLRVSPGSLGVPLLEQSIVDDAVKDPYWPTYYKDGLVPTLLGSMQSEALEKIREDKNIKQAKMKFYEQINCIAIHGSTGRMWKNEIFDVSTSPNLLFKYKKDVPPWLMPIPDMLGTIACKMLRICEFIKSSSGIIVVYSNYNWSGIIPLALALEHAGFDRYGGSKLLHEVPSSKKYPKLSPYRFKGITNPRYVVISGDQDIMKGSKSITDLLATINSRENKDGKQVKVVLITPIASEGLTIKNTREIHILNPWYHINNLEQVIGRTIRTCSHVLKPIEERNVSVYLHTTVAMDSMKKPMDTADLHSYRISARKLSQTNTIIQILRDHAWDCSLMKEFNYIPKDVFRFSIRMRTSQGTEFDYTYGNNAEDEPRCGSIEISNKKRIRPDMYMDIVPTIQTRLRKYVSQKLDQPDHRHVIIPIPELPNILRLQEFPEVVQSTLFASLEKNSLLTGYNVFIHKNSLYVVPAEKAKKAFQINIHKEEAVQEVPAKEQLQVFEYIMNIENDEEATVYLYNNLYDDTWLKLAYHIIETSKIERPAWLDRIAELLYHQGALVHHSEYPSLKTKQDYIGYFDFFKKDLQMYILGANEKLREASDGEVRAIQSKRKLFVIPKEGEQPKDFIGLYIPYKGTKDTKTKLIFKILKKDTKVRATNPGTVCSSYTLPELEEILLSLGINIKKIQEKKGGEEKYNKPVMCNILQGVMLQKKRLYLPPLYKPNLKK